MKFFIYNPGPPDNRCNPICNKFHLTTTYPLHCFDCYREAQRIPLSFRCNDRILGLAEPHPRHKNKKFEKELWPFKGIHIVRETKISSRLEHLATPIFRKVFTTRQINEHRPNVIDHVKKNLNLSVQRSMYNMYSRLENVKFPNIPEPIRKPTPFSNEDLERQMKSIERLSQPRKPSIQEIEEVAVEKKEKRPINMASIERLSAPRKIKTPEEYVTFSISVPSRPLKSNEYYQKLSQPRKVFEEDKGPEPKLKSMERTKELAVQWSRLQRRKFMKGDNDKFRFPVSRAALQYTASAKIIKLAVPRKVAEGSNEAVVKRKKKK